MVMVIAITGISNFIFIINAIPCTKTDKVTCELSEVSAHEVDFTMSYAIRGQGHIKKG